jgi:hypothetical protein
MRLRLALVLTLALLRSFPATGQEERPIGAYKALGGGARLLCGTVIKEMGKGPEADQLLGNTVVSWFHGYLTAYNETLARSPEIEGDLSKGFTELDVVNMIADHGTQHPDQIIPVAAREVVMFLFRLRSNDAKP